MIRLMRLSLLALPLLVGACTACSLNGGWERSMNPFCLED